MSKGIIRNWSEDDVAAWIKKENIKANPKKFTQEGVDGTTLLRITESDLKDLGVSKLSDRKFFMERLKQLAYFEVYPAAKDDDESTRAGDGSTRNGSKTSVEERKNEPASSDYHLSITKKFTYVYGGASVAWEIIMSVALLNPLLHILTLFPAGMTGLESASWWYRA